MIVIYIRIDCGENLSAYSIKDAKYLKVCYARKESAYIHCVNAHVAIVVCLDMVKQMQIIDMVDCCLCV